MLKRNLPVSASAGSAKKNVACRGNCFAPHTGQASVHGEGNGSWPPPHFGVPAPIRISPALNGQLALLVNEVSPEHSAQTDCSVATGSKDYEPTREVCILSKRGIRR